MKMLNNTVNKSMRIFAQRHSCLFMILAAITFFSCRKEGTPQPSPMEQDPFARQDNPASEADHQIYLLYKETGIPVLYSDTVSTNPLTVLKVGYHVTSNDSSLRVQYLQHSGDVLTGVNFVKNDILPYLGGGLKPYSVLLADSATGRVVTTINGVRTIVNMVYSAYPGLNTLVLAKVAAISTMAPDTLTYYRKDIFKSILQIKLAEQDKLLADFYAVSAAYYNKYAYGDGSITGYLAYQPRESYGLVSQQPLPAAFYSTGTQSDDLSNYFDVVLTMSEEQFAAQYGSYPLVMTKYKLFIKALTALGFKMP